jgi:hypothetical protein
LRIWSKCDKTVRPIARPRCRPMATHIKNMKTAIPPIGERWRNLAQFGAILAI